MSADDGNLHHREQLVVKVLHRSVLKRFSSGETQTGGGLHDDARSTAFGDLLHRFSITGVLDCFHDLVAKKRKQVITSNVKMCSSQCS